MKGNHLWKSRESLLSQEISLYVPMEVFLSRVKISFTINLVYESLGKDFTKTINVSYNPTNQLWEQVEKIN